MPGTRYEILDGELLYVSPADGPHGATHSRLCALLEAHTARRFRCASDMLTRTSATSDFAPDASVFPRAADPKSGGRQLDELSFEIEAKGRLGRQAVVTRKARALVGRGVRRVFAIDLKRSRVLEWSSNTNGWTILRDDAAIDDRAFVTPLPIADLVSEASSDDAVARALVAKKNRVIAEDRARTVADDIVKVLRARGLDVDRPTAAAIRATHDRRTLNRMLVLAATCRHASAVLAAARPAR